MARQSLTSTPSPASDGMRIFTGKQAGGTPHSSAHLTVPEFFIPLQAAWDRVCAHRLSLADIWLALPPLLVFVMLNLSQIRPNDFWWHLRTGQIIAAAHSIPAVDLFSFSRGGQPWINQSWLMEVIFYLLYSAGGLPLVIFCHSIAITTGYALLELACLQTTGWTTIGKVRAAALATLAGAAAGLSNWTIRPQLVSFTLFGLLVLIIELHRRRGSQAIWMLPALFALWANLHGGFVFGVALLAIYILSRAIEDLIAGRSLGKDTSEALIAGGLSIVALSANPAGPLGMLNYVLGFFQSKVTQDLNVEFMPLNIRNLDGALFVAVTLLFLFVAYQRRARLPLYNLLALLAFGLYSLYSRRVTPWYGLALAPAFAALLASPADVGLPPSTKASLAAPRANQILSGLLCLVALASLPWVRPYLPIAADRQSYFAIDETPVQAAVVLCELPAGTRIFNDIAYGSYLEWACPSIAVFMDTRFELYPKTMWDDYLYIGHGQFGWEEKLVNYGIDTLLVHKENQEVLVKAAQASGTWKTLYEDKQSILMQKLVP